MADPRAAELAAQLDRAFETSVNEPSLRHPPPFATQAYGDVGNIPEAPALYIPGSLINATGPVARSSLEVQLQVARELVETADADLAAATPRGPESVVGASSIGFQAAHDTAYTTSRAPLVALVDETESLAAQVRALQRSLHARISALSSPEYRPSLRVEVQTFLQARDDPGCIAVPEGRHIYPAHPSAGHRGEAASAPHRAEARGGGEQRVPH